MPVKTCGLSVNKKMGKEILGLMQIMKAQCSVLEPLLFILLHYLINLLMDNKELNQTGQKHKLIWAFEICICLVDSISEDSLMLSILGKNFSRRYFKIFFIFFFFFSENRLLNFMQILGVFFFPENKLCMRCQNVFSGKM